jgi:hypothetical protein
MAECNPWDKASQQHMALRQQEDSEHPVTLIHQRQQVALVAVQVLDQNQQLESLQDLQKPIQTLYSTEGN